MDCSPVNCTKFVYQFVNMENEHSIIGGKT